MSCAQRAQLTRARPRPRDVRAVRARRLATGGRALPPASGGHPTGTSNSGRMKCARDRARTSRGVHAARCARTQCAHIVRPRSHEHAVSAAVAAVERRIRDRAYARSR